MMNKVLGVVCFVLAASVVGAFVVIGDLRGQIVQLQKDVRKMHRDLRDVPGQEGTVDVVQRVELVERAVQKQKEEVAQLRRGQERTVQNVELVEDRLAHIPDGPEGGALIASADGQASNLDDLVERVIEEKLREKGFQGGKRKPLVDDFAKELNLSVSQMDQMVLILDEAKRAVFDLAKIPRPDGSSMADDLVAAFTSAENPEEEVKHVFFKIFTEKVPGRDTTYIAEVLQIQVRVREQLSTTLDDEQLKAYDRSGVDPLDVQTGYDPFAQYLMESAR